MATIKAKAPKSNKTKGEAAGTVIYSAAITQGKSSAAMIEAIKACDTSTPEAQTFLRRAYISGRFAALMPETVEDARKAALAIVDGVSPENKGGTKRTEGRTKRTEDQQKRYNVFKADWSRLLEQAGVATVSTQGTKKGTKRGTKGKAKGKTGVQVNAELQGMINPAPKVKTLADAYHHLEVMRKALIDFEDQNKAIEGFEPYARLIGDFVQKVATLPH